MAWLGIGVGVTDLPVYQRSGGGASGLAAPVITQTSTAGANPFTFSVAENATYFPGYYWNAQSSAVSDFATTLSDVIQQIEPGDLSGTDDIILTGFVTATSGAMYTRLRVGIEDGLGGYTWGAWSNVLFDTIVSVNALVMVQEGDSITAWATNGHADLWTAAHGTWTVHKQAVGGNALTDLIGRSATGRAYDAQVLTVLIGANDLVDTTAYPTATDYFNAVMSYVANYRSDGAKVVVGTILPQSGATLHNSRRATFNTLLKAALGTSVDAVADYDSTAMGPDAAAADTTLYGDGVHPTDGTGTPTSDGQELYMLPQYTGAVNYALGVANQVKQFTFTDNGSAAASTPTASNAVTMIGLGYSETKAYSVSSGHDVRKNGGSWVTNGTGTVTNGDTLEVRATSSATPAGTVNVVLTVGTVSDTFSITTASAGLTTTYRSSAAGNGGFGANFTFSSVSYYAGQNIIAISTVNGTPSALTLGGTSGTLLASLVTGNKSVTFWSVTKGSGGSGNIVVTAGSVYSIGYTLWSTDSTATFGTSQSLAYDYLNDPQRTPSITMPSGGSILAMGMSESPSPTYVPETGTTEVADFEDTGFYSFWAGERATTGTVGLNGAAFSGFMLLAISLAP